MAITVQDIADRCGVSTATVSYVLSGKSNKYKISVATKQKVLTAADELGYVYKNSVTRCQPKIAVFWPQKSFEMALPTLFNGLSNVISNDLSQIILMLYPYKIGHLSDQKDLWIKDTIDCAMIIGTNEDDLDYIDRNPTEVQLILINRTLPKYSSVTTDSQNAGVLAAQHAINKGKENIALVLNPAAYSGLNARAKAVINYCKEHDITIQSNHLYYSSNDIDSGYTLGLDIVRKGNLPKVIICVYDIVGLGLISAFNESGIVVGKDVEIISTSSGLPSIFARSTPPMTVVDLKFEEIGEKALRMAIDIVTNKITPPQTIVVYPEIIYRQSSPFNPTLDDII